MQFEPKDPVPPVMTMVLSLKSMFSTIRSANVRANSRYRNLTMRPRACWADARRRLPSAPVTVGYPGADGSTRLPGKSLARVLGRSLIYLMLERVAPRTLDAVVVATTTAARDDEIAAVARARGALVFRGDEEDVLGRYMGAAAFAGAEVVVRLTADCPLLDRSVIDRVVTMHRSLRSQVDLVTNAPPAGRTYPDGMDVEVFTTAALARIAAVATDSADREHVARRFHRPPFRTAVVDLEPSAGDVRITVDYPRDLERVRAIFESLYPRNPSFRLEDILALLDALADSSHRGSSHQQVT